MANYTQLVPYEVTKNLCTIGFIDSRFAHAPLYAEVIDWLMEKGVVLNFSKKDNMWECEICHDNKTTKKIVSDSFTSCADAAISFSVKMLRKKWGLDK